MELLTVRYAEEIRGTLSCYDRIVITGTLIGVCYAEGMASHLRANNIRLFDFPRFAEPLRDEIRDNAQKVAQQSGLDIEFIRSKHAFRKEERIQSILEERGDHPGLVHIFSAMEPCTCFEPWHDKNTGKTTLRCKDGKCLHFYFYFIHEVFGLCYLRVPTWAPFRLQFYCNGHHWLKRQLEQEGIAFRPLDNTFVDIADFARAQELADAFPVQLLHVALNQMAAHYCPALNHFTSVYPEPYHWSLMQVEYATDIVFYRQEDLHCVYEVLVRTAIHTVKPENVATFLGRKLHPNFQDELGNDFHTRLEGTRIKHHMGPVAIKLYDKQALVLRIETTVNDVTFFKHYREVEHRGGTKEMKLAPMQKTIYSLGALRELLLQANQRYLAFLSQLIDPSAGVKKLEKLCQSVRQDDRTYPGFNLFNAGDLDLFIALTRGQWQISGFQNSTLRLVLPDKTSPQLSRLLKRLHLHGLIKKVANTYKYYLTTFGREVALTALKLRELVIIPQLAALSPNKSA